MMSLPLSFPCWPQMLALSGCCRAGAQMFMERYNPEATPFTKNPDKYIRWSVADVQRLITDDLFEARDRDAVAAAAAAAASSKGSALATRGSGLATRASGLPSSA